MKEVFQNYQHYRNWIENNWEEGRYSRELYAPIINSGLMIERKHNCSGESHRCLTIEEFIELEKDGFILIPTFKL